MLNISLILLFFAKHLRADVDATDFMQSRQDTAARAQTFAEDTCFTNGCIKAASAVINYMDETVNPCDDFFDFACGGFINRTVIPDEKAKLTMFDELQDELYEKLRALVEDNIKDTDPTAFQIVKKAYASCINTVPFNKTKCFRLNPIKKFALGDANGEITNNLDKVIRVAEDFYTNLYSTNTPQHTHTVNTEEDIDKRGLQPLTDLLKEFGGWPVVEGDNWSDGNFSWIETSYKNRQLGYSLDSLFDFSVTKDIRNSPWRIIWFDQANVGMDREYLMKGLDDKDVQAYLQYMTDSAILLGADPERAQTELRDVLQFSIDIANISMSREERRNLTKLYNTITLGDLSALVPDIPWLEYINNLLPLHLEVDKMERVGLSDPNYFTNLTKILANTPKRVVANYMIWRVVAESIPYLSENIRNFYLTLRSKLEGITSREPRWKECMSFLSNGLPIGLGSLYVKNFFNIEAKRQAEELVANVRAEFVSILGKIDWMDNKTRNEALKKAQRMEAYVGFPEELLLDEKLEEHYSGLVVESSEFLDNARRIAIFDTDYSFGKLRKKYDKLDWKAHAQVAIVNAFYSSFENSIVIPAGILQGIFFEPDRPKYMNYGAIGSAIGHEITHGFDDEGRQFDYNGNLKNWWDPATEKSFLEKARCIIHQYSNYTAPENGMKLNGINTQGENIADNGGIREAYRAYTRRIKNHDLEKKLPGLNYTPLQMFWISNAQVWCSKYRPEALKNVILTNSHSPSRFRVIGPLSNYGEFSKDWGCPLGTQMNPRNKCQVW